MLPRMDSAEPSMSVGVGVGSVRLLSARGRRKAVGDSGQVLDGAVVKVARYLAPLDVARLECTVEQELALSEPEPEPARERPRDRNLNELQCEQRAQRYRREASPEPAPDVFDQRVPVVRLEQQCRARRRADRQVDLEQLAGSSLVAILRLGQVADAGFDRAGVE